MVARTLFECLNGLENVLCYVGNKYLIMQIVYGNNIQVYSVKNKSAVAA
jgi:hypothetical protein